MCGMPHGTPPCRSAESTQTDFPHSLQEFHTSLPLIPLQPGRPNVAGIKASAVIAAMIHQPRWKTATCPACDAGEAITATKIATPMAIDPSFIMLITAEPVAKEDGGKADVPVPMSVGEASPDPDPERNHADDGECDVRLGSQEGRPQKLSPETKSKMPAQMTGAAPKRLISLPARSIAVIGTRSGPGAIAKPACKADQPHTV